MPRESKKDWFETTLMVGAKEHQFVWRNDSYKAISASIQHGSAVFRENRSAERERFKAEYKALDEAHSVPFAAQDGFIASLKIHTFTLLEHIKSEELPTNGRPCGLTKLVFETPAVPACIVAYKADLNEGNEIGRALR